jgi:hypothetical protein
MNFIFRKCLLQGCKKIVVCKKLIDERLLNKNKWMKKEEERNYSYVCYLQSIWSLFEK